MSIYRQYGALRVLVAGVYPAVRRTDFSTGARMDKELSDEKDAGECAWLGYGISKGITSPEKDLTVFSSTDMPMHGAHRSLAEGFEDLDPMPQCYDEIAHIKGFGTFVRWVYFSDPKGAADVLGIDFSLAARLHSGVAYSILRAGEVVATLLRHGLPRYTRIALLNCHMCENSDVSRFRNNERLLSVADWVLFLKELRDARSGRCPRCGFKTCPQKETYCSRCGCKPEIMRTQEVRHGI